MRKMKFLKGMGAGLVVGACIGMAVAADRKGCRRFVNKAMKTVGCVIDDVSDRMGF